MCNSLSHLTLPSLEGCLSLPGKGRGCLSLPEKFWGCLSLHGSFRVAYNLYQLQKPF